MSINKDGLDTSKQPTFTEIMKIELARKREAHKLKTKPKAARRKKTNIDLVDKSEAEGVNDE